MISAEVNETKVNGETMLTLQEKLAQLRYCATRYELAAINGDEKILIAYCGRRTRRGILSAARDRADALKTLTGDDGINWGSKAADGGTMGAWSIRFTGRTQRDAYIEGELQYVGDIVRPSAQGGA